uniref:RNA-directed DNA polymerase, eukaryota n=1 Tax=Tanacetum cinerariifolium TaxID=118510 RepID=A0A6L2L0P2_TANCI|nr:RNA-directed DNA polymerase, eukaryota [Tanacetum cinerariifolium]
MAARFRSNEYHTRLISKSIFVTKFPDSTSSNDLWKLCQRYGTVVDVYIPNRKSKARKRFAFVCFIKVDNIDRLVGNLWTLWIGRMHLHANVGDVIELEESKDDLFARKRICIMTKQEDNTLEKFKIIVQGKIFVIRAKELFIWSPVFKEDKEVVYCTDDESIKGTSEDKGEASKNMNSNAESDGEGVSDTYFGENEDNLGNEQNSEQPMNEKETSQNPFNIYDLLRKRDGGVINSGLDKSIPYPSGFTPEKEKYKVGVQEMKDKNFESSHCRSEGLCPCVLEDGKYTDDQFSFGDCTNGHKSVKGGSIMEVLEDMIKVGQTMRYDMEGCMKDMENIIGLQGGHKDPNVFLKEQHILSDNFVVIFGTWIPTKTKLLIISIYAPQPRIEKRSMWTYIMPLVTHWHGDSIVMGDFNEVRSADERMGSVFNVQEAIEFNDFISNSGLKAKIQWSIEGDENSKFFHGIIYRKRTNLVIRGVMVDGEWVDDPSCVKEEFRSHFATRFQAPSVNRSKNKSPRPDGFTFEFSFLIPKVHDPKFVSNYRPISWIGSLYKVVTKILAISLSSGIASILVNGSPTSKFQFQCGLKQGDPLDPYLFILVMESLHLSFSRVVDAGIFKGIRIGNSITISHLFYADDAVFVGLWSMVNGLWSTHGCGNDLWSTGSSLGLGLSRIVVDLAMVTGGDGGGLCGGDEEWHSGGDGEWRWSRMMKNMYAMALFLVVITYDPTSMHHAGMHMSQAKPVEVGKFFFEDGKVFALGRKLSPSRNCVNLGEPCGALDHCCDPYYCAGGAFWWIQGYCKSY